MHTSAESSPISPPADARLARIGRELAYALATLPLATVWFCVLGTGWMVALTALPFVVGLPVLIALFVICDWCGAAERAVARKLLHARIAAPAPPPQPTSRILGRLRQQLTDPRTWRQQLYLIGRVVIGFPVATAIVSLGLASVVSIFAPLILLVADVDLWDGALATPVDGLLGVPAGLAGLVVTGWATRGFALASARAAAWGLGHSARNEPVAPPQPGEAVARMRAAVARSLPIQAGVALAVVAVTVLIWALTGGTFWPGWIVLGFALVLGLQVALVGALALDDVELRWLALHAALAVAIAVLCVSLWAGTASPSFWPAWVILGLAVALALHAAVVRLRRRTGAAERARLVRRVQELTRTRAGAVAAEATELQRIERDIHDGAQARLVALSMNLGRAEERLDEDPQRARELLAEARDDARQAIAELRALARGIAPPVLLDRGLDAAVAALAGANPIATKVDGRLDGRPSHAVERAAYFTIAEATANAAKHSGASTIRIQLGREGDELVARIHDDGRGGADPDGPGLTGLRRRVAALDGSLRVASQPGDGTLVEVRLPWEGG